MVKYESLLHQIALAKQHLRTLPLGSFAYRDYMKYYNKLHRQKQQFEQFIK